MVKNKEAVLVLGSKDKELTKKRVKFAESKIKNKKNFRVIFSGTEKEVNWMKNNSRLKAIMENRSKTTPENLMNSKKIIGNSRKIWIITDRSHVFRTRYLAKKIFRDQPIEVIGIKVPPNFMIKQIWYEFSRLIRHVFE